MKLIIANWKMNPATTKEAERLVRDAIKVKTNRGVSIVLCPPFVYLPAVKKALKAKKNPTLGVQDIFWKGPTGAYTGEISAEIAKNLGVRFAVVGHSERRLNLAETDEMVAKKAASVISAGLSAVVCVGEPLSVREEGEKMAEAYVMRQLEAVLTEIPNPDSQKFIIAYEPFWAISTARGRVDCTPQIAVSMMNAIRAFLQRRTARRDWNVLYGGSVNPMNAAQYVNLGEGVLVGAASLKAQEFAAIAAAMK